MFDKVTKHYTNRIFLSQPGIQILLNCLNQLMHFPELKTLVIPIFHEYDRGIEHPLIVIALGRRNKKLIKITILIHGTLYQKGLITASRDWHDRRGRGAGSREQWRKILELPCDKGFRVNKFIYAQGKNIYFEMHT